MTSKEWIFERPVAKFTKAISTAKVKSTWRKVSDKAFPDVSAYLLKDREFHKILSFMRKNKGVVDTRLQEYGVDFSDDAIEACTFEFEGHMIIFIKESVDLDGALTHELEHVANWKHENKH